MTRWLLIAALPVGGLALAACLSDGDTGDVPDGWTEVRAEQLAYAVPGDFTELDPPRDKQRVVEHARGDPDNPLQLELIGVYQNQPTTRTGSELTLRAYTAHLFGLGGLAAGSEYDVSVDEREELAVDGAVEAEVLAVSYFEPRVDEEVIQTVVLVRTGDAIYDLRYVSAASRHDDEIASSLPGTVRLP